MRICLLIVVIFASCLDRQVNNNKNKVPTGNNIFSEEFNISIIDSEFPLKISHINLDKQEVVTQIDDEVYSCIKQTVIEYYKKECIYDDSLTSIQDNYIKTIRLKNDTRQIFLILLKHFPTGNVVSKVLFYDNQRKVFIGKPIDYNLHALYYYNNGKLESSNLKTIFEVSFPEIEIVDFNSSGKEGYKFTRLWHNGTANAIETIVINIYDNAIDTLDFDQKWLESRTGDFDY